MPQPVPPGELTFRAIKLPAEAERLATWLSSQRWPFHGTDVLTHAAVLASIERGTYSSDDQTTYWIEHDGAPIGLVRLLELDDIGDGFPLFDLRIAESHRGGGIGKAAVQWLTKKLFDEHPVLTRIEGTTRVDNAAMRRVLESCGYVKEGHYRQAWRDSAGTMHDAVHYATLRSDWESERVTPIVFAS